MKLFVHGYEFFDPGMKLCTLAKNWFFSLWAGRQTAQVQKSKELEDQKANFGVQVHLYL
jgi:hypothetical protein